jgi:hypothetical protein
MSKNVLVTLILFAITSRSWGFDVADYTLVDLTHPYNEDTIYWPTSPSRFELKRLAFGKTPGGWFYAANAICTPEHGGTHLDKLAIKSGDMDIRDPQVAAASHALCKPDIKI